MPTQDELDADDALRAVFLSALYDVAGERGRQEQDVVNDILPRMKLGDLPVSRVAALVTGLIRDDLIEAPPGYLGAADEYEPTVRLTAFGAERIKNWVRGRTSRELPLPPSKVFNIAANFHGGVSGSSATVGYGNTVTNTITNNFGSRLTDVVAVGRALLAEYQTQLPQDDYDEYEDDLVVVEEQAKSPTPNVTRLRKALSSVNKWAYVPILAAASDQLKNAVGHALAAITG